MRLGVKQGVAFFCSLHTVTKLLNERERVVGWSNTAQKSTYCDWIEVPVNMAIQCLMKSGVKIPC